MARIRTIKPAFFKHVGLFDSERASGLPLRVAYAGLWTVCDRDGRFKWRPREIKVEVLPHDEVDMDAVMTALTDAGFIGRYAVDGEEFGLVPTFRAHQRINAKEPESGIPPPPGEKFSDAGTVPACAEGNGKEKKGRERILLAEAFERFWIVCPRKAGKGKARRQFEKICETVSPEILIEAMNRYAAVRRDQDLQYTAHPATWLYQERWLDELPAAPAEAPIHASWKDDGARLISDIGKGAFSAYFANSNLDPGPPVVIRVARPILKSMIEQKFAGALARVFGAVTIEVVK
jgi:hypothetical protein